MFSAGKAAHGKHAPTHCSGVVAHVGIRTSHVEGHLWQNFQVLSCGIAARYLCQVDIDLHLVCGQASCHYCCDHIAGTLHLHSLCCLDDDLFGCSLLLLKVW